MKAVVDPGVLIAAAINPRGTCGRVLIAAIDGRYTLISSPALLAELGEVLLRPRFRRYFSEDEAHQYVARIAEISSAQPDTQVQAGLTPDPDDDYLVALAQQAGADCLVSSDPHLVGLRDPQPPVLAPRAFLDELNKQDAEGDTEVVR